MTDDHLQEEEWAAQVGHCGIHECPSAVGPALPGVRRGVRGRRDRPGTGRGEHARPPVRAAAPRRLVVRGRAQRPGRPAARGGPRVRPAEPGAAAGRADHRLRAADGGRLRAPPGGRCRMARRAAGHGGPGRTAGPDGRGRGPAAGRRETEPAADRHRRRGDRVVRGGAPDAPAGVAQRAAGGRGRHGLRHGLRVHQIGGRVHRKSGAGRARRTVARPGGDRRPGVRRTTALAGGLPGCGADRTAGHGDRGQPGGRGGRRHLAVRRGLPVRVGGHGGGTGQRRTGGGRPDPAHGRAAARTGVRCRRRGRGGTSAGRCRSRSRGTCGSRSGGAVRWCCRWNRNARSADLRTPAARP